MENTYHKRLCAETKRHCNPARQPQCLCWWESDSPQDFIARSSEHTGLKPATPVASEPIDVREFVRKLT